MSSGITIGVLALQGAFAKHIEMLTKLGIHAIEVRRVQELEQCDALIIPGGESTTIMRHIDYNGMRDALNEFFEKKPAFGTCAGLILMSQKILSHEMKPFKLIEISVERNAFGSQAESFRSEIEMRLTTGKPQTFSALFIRAPRIRDVSPNVQVLAEYENEPILVRQGYHLAATFHPELTDDPAIHTFFVNLVKESKRSK
jgi:pyridoxal 5'-phosphate synthase pdxT subunit